MLLEKGVDIDARDNWGRSRLFGAAENRDEAFLADVEANAFSGRTPLSIAAGRGYIAAVQLLLERGANVDAGDIDGRTPLFWAIEKAYDRITGELLSLGAIDASSKDI
ncbi:hypothetical protein H634G_10575 [Metarhizium anisopliae BRIP 53293]|uniref:Uncharacterized protein n=1 Tax=Metarhizium anisopliae BRIP 53293 TaxID=1291518 RepID=A0A0D9NJG6_METAN|nr:hypothetical protein H634G_10575 [Metarhizium anisopliae BRIP 53293]